MIDIEHDLGLTMRCCVDILSPQWRQATGISGAGITTELCASLAGMGSGEGFPAPWAVPAAFAMQSMLDEWFGTR